MTKTQVLAVVAFVVLFGIGGNIWLLVQEARGRIRTRRWNTRVLRALSTGCAALVVGTALFARPWYWDFALAVTATLALIGILRLVRALWQPARPSWWRALSLSFGAMLLGVVLLGMAGVAAVLDAASLASAEPALLNHGGGVLQSPVLYQLFWGTDWEHPMSPAVMEAVTFETGLSGSGWEQRAASAGFGLKHLSGGGCWIDPNPARPGTSVTGTGSSAFASELASVFEGVRPVEPCPGTHETVPTTLPATAVVALWLPPEVPFDISGVAAHGSAPWPGSSSGLVVAGLPGSYAFWGTRSCQAHPACRALPSYATPTYALSHEFLEAATNPHGTGWYASAPLSWTARYVLSNGPPSLLGLASPPVYPGEVADLCEPGSVAPGQPLVFGRLSATSPLQVTPFFQPGKGCVA